MVRVVAALSVVAAISAGCLSGRVSVSRESPVRTQYLIPDGTSGRTCWFESGGDARTELACFGVDGSRVLYVFTEDDASESARSMVPRTVSAGFPVR